MASVDQPSVMDEAYKEFVMQLASWDTRRDFWLQTDYYKQRMVGNSKADAALLDEMINNIVFIPGDFTRAVNDSVKLIAETAPDANNLLRQYVAFASQRAASHLNDELKGAWAARTIQMKAQVKRQEEVAKAIYDRRLNSIEQALKIASSITSLAVRQMCQRRNCLILSYFYWVVRCSRRDWKIYRPSVRPLISTMIRIGPC